MKAFLSRNIGTTGRLVRAVIAVLLLVGAGLGFQVSPWLGIALVLSGAFVLFEALRGWCLLRACGIKTKL